MRPELQNQTFLHVCSRQSIKIIYFKNFTIEHNLPPTGRSAFKRELFIYDAIINYERPQRLYIWPQFMIFISQFAHRKNIIFPFFRRFAVVYVADAVDVCYTRR